MNAVLLAAALFLVLLGVGFSMLFAQLLSRECSQPLPDDWEAMFSPARYRAMERLLEETDYQYLASRSGGNKVLEKIKSDLDAKGVNVTAAEIKKQMADFLVQAVHEVEGDKK